ncbi:protein FAM131C isoform X2 [Misgurnus anguillicaudatus]|uniref:protein FAM131C isoform X2 n=2 Tax=Misgurnus anguillicaudatus TaxID=75329 RepID=UPI002434CEE6|nr:protein FAM131C isoform X2 [Misgurnus anguillicaudatus]
MGSCLCKGHQAYLSVCSALHLSVISTSNHSHDLQSAQQLPMEELQSYAEGQPIFQGNHQSYNGGLSDKRSSSGYDIGELATSSLLGLLATIKDHITKPTAMAQGRVAHLIEWKSWGGEATSGGLYGWSRDGGGWGGVGAALQEDEQLYSHLTDEIKEARFAAGVAEQFALAEAAMNAWSTQDIESQATTSTIPLQDPEGLYLSQFLLDGGSLGVPQHLYRMHMEANDETSSLGPSQPPKSHSPSQSSQRPEQQQIISQSERAMRHADSISLSEDEVFYN